MPARNDPTRQKAEADAAAEAARPNAHQEYPKVLYKDDERVTVSSAEEESALGEGWSDHS